jgi:hypothetical protein
MSPIIISLILKRMMYRQIHMEVLYIIINTFMHCPWRWPSGLRRGPVAARLLILWVRIPPRTWKFVSCECCVLSGTDLFVELITRPGESYRVWCAWVWTWSLDNEEALAHQGLGRKKDSNLHALFQILFFLHAEPILLKLSTPHKISRGLV